MYILLPPVAYFKNTTFYLFTQKETSRSNIGTIKAKNKYAIRAFCLVLCYISNINLFGLITRIPDDGSRLVILDLAVEQSKALIETLKLHIFREDNVVFPMANNYLSIKVLDSLSKGLV